MIELSTHLDRLRLFLDQFPVVGLIGARQVGKTTLAKAFAAELEGEVTHFDLENPATCTASKTLCSPWRASRVW